MNTRMHIEIEKTHAHAFLAEYDFKLHLVDFGRRIASVDMTGDSGGLSRIDVYQVDPNTWAFKDHAKAFCVHVKRKEIVSCGLECAEEGVSSLKQCNWKVGNSRVGYFDFDADRKWRFFNRRSHCDLGARSPLRNEFAGVLDDTRMVKVEK